MVKYVSSLSDCSKHLYGAYTESAVVAHIIVNRADDYHIHIHYTQWSHQCENFQNDIILKRAFPLRFWEGKLAVFLQPYLPRGTTNAAITWDSE